jgi:hypothetical protein
LFEERKMSLFLIGLSALTATASPSLNDTHERLWFPAGKSPAFTYRMRRQPSCANAQLNHHQAGKSALPARTRCSR